MQCKRLLHYRFLKIYITVYFFNLINFPSVGAVVGEHLDDIIPMLRTNLHPDKDPELRLKFFSLLSRLVMSAGETLDSTHRFGDFTLIVVKDMVIPNVVWHAGRTAAAIRTIAASCLWALLQSGMLNAERVSL